MNIKYHVVSRYKHSHGPLPLTHSYFIQFKYVNCKKNCFSVNIPNDCVKIGGSRTFSAMDIVLK